MVTSRLVAALAVAAMLTACQGKSPSEAALATGLIPPQVDLASNLPTTPPDPESPMGVLLLVTRDYQHMQLPEPPPLPDMRAMQRRMPAYPGWDTDRVDGSSFDAITNSVNGILQRMPPDLAEDFDRVIKYIMMQVTKDPLVAKKAATGQPVSDAELLTLVQSYIGGQTPRDIVELAAQMKQRDLAPAARPEQGQTPFQGM